VQKATEVGVRSIRLVRAQRAEGGEPSPDRLDRLRRIAREAARQSGRTIVPDLTAAQDLQGIDTAGTDAFVLDPRSGAPPLAQLLSGAGAGAGSILIGPEGGLEDGEVAQLEADGWRRAGLGPRILRTETAGIVACALLLHTWGDLGSRRQVDVPRPGS
jgi:16S rRNA (uracil1498-N3)-methyltransferase